MKTWLEKLKPAQRKQIASIGGQTVSQNKKHMEAIGRLGGLKTSKDREFMRMIGAKGGKAKKK